MIRAGGWDWHIIERSRSGHALKVSPNLEILSGTFLEARVNLGLAVYDLKLTLWQELPSWIRRFIRKPEMWWVEW